MPHAHILVLAQVGGDLLRTPGHHAPVGAGVIRKHAVGAEYQIHGVFIPARAGGDAPEPGDLFGQFLGFQNGRRAQSNGHPAVPQGSRPPDGRVAVPANPDGRVRPLHRLGQKTHAADVVMRPVEFGVVGSPQLLENADIFVGDLAPLRVGVQPHSLELLLHPAHAGPQDEAPAGKNVQRRQYFGGEDGIAVGQYQHMGAQPHAGSAGGQKVERRQRFKVGVFLLERRYAVGGVGIERIHLVGNDDVVADPNVVKRVLLGAQGQAPQVVGRGHRAPAGQRASESCGHWACLRGGGLSSGQCELSGQCGLSAMVNGSG